MGRARFEGSLNWDRIEAVESAFHALQDSGLDDQQAVDALEASVRGLEHLADLRLHTVAATSELGFGVGLGIAGTVDLGTDHRFLPGELHLSASVENLAGYMGGQEQEWSLGLDGNLNLESTRNGNVFQELFPPTLRLTASAEIPATETRLIADFEKSVGSEQVATYYGIQQPLTPGLRVMAGAYTSQDGDRYHTYGLEAGQDEGLRLGFLLADGQNNDNTQASIRLSSHF